MASNGHPLSDCLHNSTENNGSLESDQDRSSDHDHADGHRLGSNLSQQGETGSLPVPPPIGRSKRNYVPSASRLRERDECQFYSAHDTDEAFDVAFDIGLKVDSPSFVTPRSGRNKRTRNNSSQPTNGSRSALSELSPNSVATTAHAVTGAPINAAELSPSTDRNAVELTAAPVLTPGIPLAVTPGPTAETNRLRTAATTRQDATVTPLSRSRSDRTASESVSASNGDGTSRSRSDLTEGEEQQHPSNPTGNDSLLGNLFWSRWRDRGKKLQESTQKLMMEESTKDLRRGSKSERRINLSLLAAVLWRFLEFIFPRRHRKTICRAIVKVVFHCLGEWFDDDYNEMLMQESSKLMRKHVFQPWKICQAIDTKSSGAFNCGTVDAVVKKIEGKDKCGRGSWPSSSTIKRMHRQFEDHPKRDLDMGHREEKNDLGHSYIWDFNVMLRAIIEATQTEHIAITGSDEEPFLLAVTADGAPLGELGFVAAGLKPLEERCKDPLTIHLPPEEQKHLNKFQSRDQCLLFQITFGVDCGDPHDKCFGTFWEHFQEPLVVPAVTMTVMDENGEEKAVTKPELSNFLVASPQDLLSGWKVTGIGGARRTYPCTCCMVHKDCLHKFKDPKDCVNCNKWCDQMLRCYCQEFETKPRLESLQKRLESHMSKALDEHFEKLDSIREKSTIDDDPEAADPHNDPNHLHCIPRTDAQTTTFDALLTRELELRYDDDDELCEEMVEWECEEKRSTLEEMLEKERDALEARVACDRQKLVKFMTAEQAIPCTLHLRMRVIEKLFWSLLSHKYDLYLDGDTKVRKEFVKAANQHMNRVVLGTVDQPYVVHWQLKTEEGKIVKKNMNGRRARKCLAGMKGLADVLFAPELDQSSLDPTKTRATNMQLCNQWNQSVDLTQTIFCMMDSKEAYDGSLFHLNCALFMDLYVDLLGGDNITCCVHCIGSGHLTHFLEKYGNLSMFSQEGWEALNQLISEFYHRNTNRGGSQGNSNSSGQKGNHLDGVARMMTRRNGWLLGCGYQHFEQCHPVSATSNPNVI